MLGSDYPFPLGESHPGKLIESAQWLSTNVKVRLIDIQCFCHISLTASQSLSNLNAALIRAEVSWTTMLSFDSTNCRSHISREPPDYVQNPDVFTL